MKLWRSGIIISALGFIAGLGNYWFQSIISHRLTRSGEFGLVGNTLYLVELLSLPLAIVSTSLVHYIAHYRAHDNRPVTGLDLRLSTLPFARNHRRYVDRDCCGTTYRQIFRDSHDLGHGSDRGDFGRNVGRIRARALSGDGVVQAGGDHRPLRRRFAPRVRLGDDDQIPDRRSRRAGNRLLAPRKSRATLLAQRHLQKRSRASLSLGPALCKIPRYRNIDPGRHIPFHQRRFSRCKPLF